MDKNATPKMRVKLALLLIAQEKNLLSRTGGQRLLERLLQTQSTQTLVAASRTADAYRTRPWDFTALWTRFGAYLNRYIAPRRLRRVQPTQRKRGYDDKGTAAPFDQSARLEAQREGSLEGILDQLEYCSLDYEDRETDRWLDLLSAGAFALAKSRS